MKAITPVIFPKKRVAVLMLLLCSSEVASAATKLATPQGPPPPNLCNTAEHHQLDFWVGNWDVFRTDTNQLVAHSRIEKLYGGCAVRENWMPLTGAGGGSLSSYRPNLRQWRQVWTDSANNLNDYTGTWDGKRLNFVGASITTTGARLPLRMTYERLPDGTVIQTGYQKAKTDEEWVPAYKFAYRQTRDLSLSANPAIVAESVKP